MRALKAMFIAIAMTGGLSVAPAVAQDLYSGYNYNMGLGFDWDGFYSGVYGGGVPVTDNEKSWSGGIFTGVNVALDQTFVLGAEAQLGGDFEQDNIALDALVLAKGGASFGEALVYGTGGTGLIAGEFGYAFGGGVEYGFTDYISVRGEALGTGEWGSGPDEMRLTAGIAFHM
ncbi:hypothetical protein [Pelagibacterium xiamenense]|uniref:hypothetical protein n=1 Tax=Pelagibacterium xiamenense TaxID=2901140 RepID=UPI001E4D601F|nr:hypothetical protein [Pelagibacterium xiamenense]MCD7060898.1 hypothetical protein [Pelagibacterium xiamenense]